MTKARPVEGKRTLAGLRGEYVIDPSDPMGYGRLSVLFEGLDASGALVCVKLYRERLESKRSELGLASVIATMQALRHPHVLPLIDYGTSREFDERPFLVTPLCRRGNLRS